MSYLDRERVGQGGNGPLTDDQRVALFRFSNLCGVLQIADRALANSDTLEVLVEESGPAPSWTDGDDITFNASAITNLNINELAAIHGLNYHELSHIFYTPRADCEPTRSINAMADVYRRGYNALEDQRIEGLIAAKFPSVVPYLTSAVANWIGTPEAGTLSETYALIYGRKFLPESLRKAARDAFDPKIRKRVEEIIDEYRTLTFDTQYPGVHDAASKRAVELVTEFTQLVRLQSSPCTTPSKGMKQGTAQDGKAESKKAQEEGPGENAPGGGEGDSKDNEKKSGKGAGTRKQLDEKIKKAAQKAANDVLKDREVKEEMNGKLQAIKRPRGTGYKSLIPQKQGDSSRHPSPETLLAERSFQDALRLLVEECDPGWDRRTPSGKLNVTRFAQGCELDEAFDRWDVGSDGYDLEVVILMDISASMSRSVVNVENFGWLMQSAIKKAGATCTTLGFGAGSYVIYPREGAHPTDVKQMLLEGSTIPVGALEEAERLMWSSQHKYKLLIIITDGAWGYPNESEDAIRRMEALGALSAVAYLGDGSNARLHRHGAQFFESARSVDDIADWAKSLVKMMIQRKALEHR